MALKGDLLRSYDKKIAYGEEKFREVKGKGKEDTQREIIKTMLENKFSDEDIMKATKCTREILDSLKGLEN